MKKLFLSLVILVAAGIGASAMNLKEAFGALSNLPAVEVREPDYNLPVISDVVQNGHIAAAYNLDREQILVSGNAALAILNEVPLQYMVNGGCNGLVSAFVYATPDGEGANDILIAAMSGYRGSLAFLYGKADDASIEAIRQAPLHIEGSFLSLEATVPDAGEFNILLSKAR